MFTFPKFARISERRVFRLGDPASLPWGIFRADLTAPQDSCPRIKIRRVPRTVTAYSRLAIGLAVPDGFLLRLGRIPLGSHIVALVPSRQDLISLKAAAFMIWGGEDPKDYTDLQLLQPTKNEIDEAIRFVRKTNTPPQPRFYPDFEEMLGRIRELAR